MLVEQLSYLQRDRRVVGDGEVAQDEALIAGGLEAIVILLSGRVYLEAPAQCVLAIRLVGWVLLVPDGQRDVLQAVSKDVDAVVHAFAPLSLVHARLLDCGNGRAEAQAARHKHDVVGQDLVLLGDLVATDLGEIAVGVQQASQHGHAGLATANLERLRDVLVPDQVVRLQHIGKRVT